MDNYILLDSDKSYIVTNEFRRVNEDFCLHTARVNMTLKVDGDQRNTTLFMRTEDSSRTVEKDFLTIYEIDGIEADRLILDHVKKQPIDFDAIEKTLMFGNEVRPQRIGFDKVIYCCVGSDYTWLRVIKYPEYDYLFADVKYWHKQPEELNGIRDLGVFLEKIIPLFKAVDFKWNKETTEFHHKKMIREIESDLKKLKEVKNG